MTKYFLVNNASRASAYGIGTYLRQMAVCVRSIHRFELCFLDINSDAKEFEVRQEDGVTHYCIPSCHGRFHHFLFYKSILFLLEPFIDKDNPVIFHFNFNYDFDLMRLIKASYANCRIIYTIHYFNWCFTLKGNCTKFRKAISNNSDSGDFHSVKKEFEEDKRLFSLCDDILVLSKFTYRLLIRDYQISESKLHLVYNGIQPEKNKNKCPTTKEQQILFVGRLDEIKGVEYIIKAFRVLLGNNMNVHLNLVGDGNYNNYLPLCDGIWEHVTFTGKLKEETLLRFFEQATIGVQASFHEQCSYSAIEMMMYGIPLVATDTTGLAEMMDLTPQNMVHIDEEAFNADIFVRQLADKMQALLTSEKLRQQTSQKQKELFEKRYLLDKMKRSLETLFLNQRFGNNSISPDFIPYLDAEMKRIIDQKTPLDFDPVGFIGIGNYLSWRISSLEKHRGITNFSENVMLQQYLKFYQEWINMDVNTIECQDENDILRTALKIYNAQL